MDQNDDFNADPFFNDGSLQQIDASVGIDALHAVPLPSSPQVIERILDLQACGCLNRIVWSRGGVGHIAQITEDGHSVDLSCLVFDPGSLTWTLSPKQTESIGLGELNSLAWSPTGSDLAVVDAMGRLSILRPQQGASNRFLPVRSGLLDEVDELGQIIGLHWLSQDTSSLERPKTAVQYASKTDTKWSQHMAKAVSHGPRSVRAIALVDRMGRLSLVYMRPDTIFAKVTTQLVEGSGTLFTHAAFSPTLEGKLLIALHSYDAVLSTYLVRVGFPDPRQGPDATASLSVDLAISSLPSTSVGGLMDGQAYDPDSYCLTHLGVIPTSEVEKAENSPPTLFGIYSSVNRRINVTDPGFLIGSVTRRWTISSVEQTLHESFDDLDSQSGSTAPIFTSRSQQLQDKDEQLITSVSLIDNGQILSITTQDGRTDFLSTEDLSPVSYQASLTEASSLSQSGFSFPMTSFPSNLTLSPNSCVAAVITAAQKVELASIEFPQGFDDPNSPTVEVAVAALVISLSRAVWSSANIDDILSAILHSFPPSLFVPLTTQLYRTLFKDSEFINDRIQGSHLDQVVNKPVLTKVLAFHYAISFLSLKPNPPATSPSPSSQLSLSGKWAWLAANLRFVAFLLMLVNKELNQPGGLKEPLTQEYTDIICANITWALDVMRYLVAKILEVEDRETNPDFFPPPTAGEVADGSQGLVPLLLNCHWSRRLLVTLVNGMRMLMRVQQQAGTKQQMQIMRTIAEGSVGKGVGLQAIDQILNGGWSEPGDGGEFKDMAARQVEMMATGVVSGGYQGTVRRLLARALGVDGSLRRIGAREKGGVDRLKVWEDEIDERWLMLDCGSEKGKGSERRYDVHKKKIITKGIQEGESGDLMIKKCVRCGRYSEDVNGMATTVPKMFAGMMMRCVCDGSWIIEPWRK